MELLKKINGIIDCNKVESLRDCLMCEYKFDCIKYDEMLREFENEYPPIEKEIEFTFKLRDMYEKFTYEPKTVKATTLEEAIVKVREGIIGWGNCFILSLTDSNGNSYCNVYNLKLDKNKVVK